MKKLLGLIKKIIKFMLPKPAYHRIKNILKKYIYHRKPLITAFQGNLDSVLQCCIAYNKYGGYCIPLSSRRRPAVQRIFSGDVWEPDTIEFINSQPGGGDIVHAGTYFGDFLPGIASSRSEGAIVWAFEPNPENFRCAFITTYINKLDNVNLKNAALGEKNGSFSMVTSDQNGESLGGGSHLIDEDESVNSEVIADVDIVSIDNVVPLDRTVSIIQLDVEGFEQQALVGAINTIQRCKPILILESLPDEDWLANHILQLGYRITGELHDNTVLRAD